MNIQGIQHWSHSPQNTIAVDHDATNEQSIQIQSNNSTALSPELQWQPFLTDPDEIESSEERNMALGHDDPLSQDLIDFNLQEQFPFPFGENESSQAGDGQNLWPFLNAPNEEAGFPSFEPIILRSPIGTSAIGQLPTQALSGTNPQGPFHGNEHSQAGNVLSSSLISSNATGTPTPSTMTSLSAEPLVGPSAAGTVVVELVAAEKDLRDVGTPKIRQASGRRRKKEAKYLCPFRNNGCNQTFTARHNVKYHLNSHKDETPYECTECPYAAASPGTLKRHMKRHQRSRKGTGHIIIGNGTCEPQTS